MSFLGPLRFLKIFFGAYLGFVFEKLLVVNQEDILFKHLGQKERLFLGGYFTNFEGLSKCGPSKYEYFWKKY